MKQLLILTCLLLGLLYKGITQDLPPPPANLQVLPIGSYVIPMDNTYQAGNGGNFNLKAYGLIVYLLNNNVKIKWVIKTGKAKDGIDFTTLSELVKPNLVVGPASRNFKAGPFVIFTTDLVGVDALITAYYTANGLAGANRPNVYRTTALNTVDIRYDLTGYIPKGAILIDGGNQSIHISYMTAAGIPTANYTTSAGDNLTNCFGFASEPHNTASGPAVDSAIVHIKTFVQLGGNFLAQCAAVSNYENNPLGRFQTTTGITVPNSNIGTGASLSYPNPDLSYSQFESDYFSYDGSSVVQNWQISGAAINSEHNHATGTGAYASYLFATVAKLKLGLGGLVFYLNCHDFTFNLQPVSINGIRMYMNAFLTPSAFLCNLPLQLMNFSGKIINGKAQFQWNVEQNETGDHFELEQSMDGRRFNTSAVIIATGKTGLEAYTYTEKNIFTGKAFYRLKMVNKNHTISYSKVVMLNDGQKLNDKIIVLENPVSSNLTFTYTAQASGQAIINLYNTLGIKVISYHTSMSSGSNSVSFSIADRIPAGNYFMELTNNTERVVTKIVKQ